MLDQCLKSIYSTVSEDVEVIVVDNASSDGSIDMLRSEYPQVKRIANTDNAGFARANNQAFDICNADYFMLLNPDTIILDNAIELLIDKLEQNPSCAIAAPKLLEKDGSIQPSVGKFPCLTSELFDALGLSNFIFNRDHPHFYIPDDDKPSCIDWATGACLLVRRSAVPDSRKILDERYFMFSEETDLCKCLKNAGWSIIYEPRARVMHFGSGSTSQVRRDMLTQLYKSKFIYFSKHKSPSYANTYRAGIIPLRLFMRILCFLPSLLLHRSNSAGLISHLKNQCSVVRASFGWGGK